MITYKRDKNGALKVNFTSADIKQRGGDQSLSGHFKINKGGIPEYPPNIDYFPFSNATERAFDRIQAEAFNKFPMYMFKPRGVKKNPRPRLSRDKFALLREQMEKSADQMYKSYRIRLSNIDNIYFITKGGTNIGSAQTISEAKKIIDMLTEYNRNPRPRMGTKKPTRPSTATGKRPTIRLVSRRKRNARKGFFPNPTETYRVFRASKRGDKSHWVWIKSFPVTAAGRKAAIKFANEYAITRGVHVKVVHNIK